MLSPWGFPTEYNPSVSMPTIEIVDIASANTEVSHALAAGTKRFMIKAQSWSTVLKLAFVAGAVGTGGSEVCIGIPRQNSFSEDDLDPDTSYTLYLASNRPNVKVEILSWQ